MRAAIYFAPAPETALWQAGCAWLGRDAVDGRACAPALETVLGGDTAEELVSAPRRYGFHATLMAPFTIREPYDLADVEGEMRRLAERLAPFSVTLKPDLLAGFLALVPEAGGARLSALAASVLDAFQPYRAPLCETEFNRRAGGLDAERRQLLQRWGYPHVREHFRFHMTLTGALPAEYAGQVTGLAEAHFAEMLSGPVRIDRLALFTQDTRGSDFRARSSAALSGEADDAAKRSGTETVS